MANDLKLKVTLTGDGKPLSGTLHDTTKEVTDFGTTAEREGKRADEALDRPRRGAEATGQAVHEATNEVREFGTATQRSGRQASAAMDDAGRSVKTVEDYLQRVDGIGRSVRNQIVGVGAAFAGAFAADALRGQARAITQTDALAQAVGVSTTRLQEWQYAGQQVGLEADKVGDIFKDTQDKIGDFIATGGGEAADLFKNLRINVQELRQLRPDEQLLKIVDAINQIDDPSQRVFYLESIADDASRLIPLLQDGGQLLRQYSAEARDLGVAMSQIDIENAKEADQALRQIGSSVEGLTNQLIADLGPGLADTADWLSDVIREAGGAGNVMDGLVTTGEVLASLLAGRLTQGVTAYIGRIAAANAATLTLTGTLRTLRSVMATAFGPVGIVVAAAGVLYTFREELGLVPKPAREAKQAIEELTGAIDDSSRATLQSGIASYRAKLSELQTQAESVRAEIERVNDENNVPGPFRNSLVMGEGAEERSQYLRQLQTISEQSEAYKGSIKELEKELKKLGETTTRTAKPTTTLGNSQTEAAKAAAKQAESLQGLMDKLDPVAKSQRDYLADQITLQTAWAGGKLTLDQYLIAVGQLPTLYQNAGYWADEYGLKADSAAKTVKASIDPVETALKRSLERTDDAFVDFWENVISGSKNTFDAFKQVAISTLAEIIHAYTTRKITASLGLSLAGTGTAAAGNGVTGAGGGGLSDLSSLGNTIYNGIRDGFGSISWAGAPTGATPYTSGFGAQVATGGGQFGGSFSNFTGWNGVGSLGAGMAGSYLGNAAFGDSKYGGTLSTIGGAVGTYFGGPIGAAIGSFAGSALGSLGDSLFGSSRKYKAGFQSWAETPDRDYGSGGTPYYSSGYYRDGDLGRGRETPFGSFGFTFKTKYEPSDMIDLLDAMATLDETLASGASADQVDTVRDALDGWQTKLKDDSLGDLITRRYAVITDALESSASEATAKLIDRVGDITAKNAEETIPQLAQALQLGNLIDGLSGNVQDYAARVVDDTNTSLEDAFSQITAGVSAHAAVSAIADELNLTFDDMGDRAVEAALNLQQLAGGIDTLQANAQTYYQAFFTDAERQQRAIEQLSPTLYQVGLSAASSREEFRAVVESLDLNTAAGRETYTQLMSVAGAFAEISDPIEETTQSLKDLQAAAQSQVESARDAVRQAYEAFASQAFDQQVALLQLAGRDQEALNLQRQQELDTIDESLRPIQERIWALQDEQSALEDARQASADYRSALEQASSQLDGTLGNISAWIDQQTATGGSPGVNLQEAQAQFARQLALAENGDRDALNSITQYADRYQQAGQSYYGSGSGYQRIRDEVLDALGELPDQVSAEEYVAEEIKAALIEQTDGITTKLSEVLRGDNPASIGAELAGYFATLAGGIDGVLTRDQLRLVMNGKATDRQLDAMIRALDLNGDDIVSGLESVIVSGMPTDATLANVLQAQLRDNGNKALTASQVRSALSPIATDAQIRDLIRTTDANGDGLLDAQEVANARLGGLAKGIGGALDPMFDQIDKSLNGLIDYSEFRSYFKGLASDSQLKQIFTQLDTDGDGQISALEAVKQSTDTVGKNTGSLEERSLEQLQKLTNLTSEMARSTDQFIGLNSTMVSLRESIIALGVAQKEAARIEKARQQAEAAAKQRVELERQLSDYESKLDSINSKVGSTQSDVKDLASQRDAYDYVDYRNGTAANEWSDIDRSYKGYVGYIGDENAWWDGNTLKTSGNSVEQSNIKNLWDVLKDYVHAYNRATGEGDKKLLELDETDFYGEGDSRNRFQIEYGGKTYYAGYNDQGIQTMEDAWDAMQDALNSYYGTSFDWRQGDSVRDQLSDAEETLADLLGDRSSAKDQIDKLKDQIAELKKLEQYDGSHATGLSYVPFDEYRAVLHKGEHVATAEEAPAVRAFLNGRLSPPPVQQADNRQMENLLSRLAQLTQENTELLRRIEAHEGASVRVAQAGHQRSIDQLKRIADSNENIDDRERMGAMS